MDKKCVDNFETDGSAARITIDRSGVGILVFGRTIDRKDKSNLQIFVLNGEITC